ncbi:MAG: heme exporter protein CcmD [Paracoccaceae bacterium]|nr:heme exporter protein CcmD [Paracoccaceae bacterium]MDG1738888.1 heme exporter protein CcmD [Paracoccaceae bacterium]MDG2259560.1 heme exporter protein CcmD [Paracoccaceae bacterium]
MMVDLGKYAVPVLSAYAVSIAILTLLVWQSLARAAKVKRELAEYEKTRKSDD